MERTKRRKGEEMRELYNVKIHGIRPLMQNKPMLSAGGTKSGRNKSTPTPEEEAKTKLYITEDGQAYEPSSHIEGALAVAAADFRMPGRGKKSYKKAVMAGLLVAPERIIHEN